MSTNTDTIGSAAADALSAQLDLLLTDAQLDLLLTDASGALRRVNPGGFGLWLAAVPTTQPGLVAGRGRQLLGELGRITVGNAEVQPSRPVRRFTGPGWIGESAAAPRGAGPPGGRASITVVTSS